MAGRMWLGAPALAVLFTYGVAEAATQVGKPDALITQAPESHTPAWAALPAIAERLSVGLSQATPNFVHHTAQTAYWLSDSYSDRYSASSAERLSVSEVPPSYKVEKVEIAMLHRDPGHSSPPIAAP